METAVKVLLNDYAIKLSDFELETSQQVLDDVSVQEQKLIDWSLSTYTRRNFIAIVVNRTMKSELILLSECTKLLGISRNAADLLFNDTVPQGWILCERNDRGWRQVMASDMLINLYLRYADSMHDKAVELELCRSSIALLQLKQLLN